MKISKFKDFMQEDHAAGDGITGFLLYGTRECEAGQHFCVGYAYYGPGVQEHNVIARETLYVVLSGEVKVTCKGETAVLTRGDSVSFDIGDEEWVDNETSQTAEVLVIMGRVD